MRNGAGATIAMLVVSLGAIGAVGAAVGAEISPRTILSANAIQDVQLAPDGTTVFYELRKTDWEHNQYHTELWLVGTTPGAAPRKLMDGPTGTSVYRSIHATWRPNSRSLVYFSTRNGTAQLWEVDIDTGSERPLTKMEGWKEQDPRGVPGNLVRWSPDGSRLAFVASVVPPVDPNNDPGNTAKRGYVASVFWPNDHSTPTGQLWVLGVAEGSLTRLTPDTLSISDIAWAPDGRRLVVSALPVPGGRILNSFASNGLDNDLYVVAVATRKVTPLVVQPGWEVKPAWSPDGRWIGFVSQQGIKDWNYNSCVAVVSADGGTVSYPDAEAQRERGSTPGDLTWDARSEGVYFDSFRQGGRHLFYAKREGGVRQVTPGAGAYYRHFTLLPEHNLLAMTAEQTAVPADVVLTLLDRFDARRVTAVNPEWPHDGLPAMETFSWKSTDGTTIHGHLLLPPGWRLGGSPLATFVFLVGGPSMVRTGFQFDESLYPFLTFATRGYAVFLPNSRGRGGWGRAFRQAMPEHSDFLPGPYQDVMTGVDTLIARGVADPARLGLAGFSYGACLTGYAITQTDRFRAASIGEGFFDWVHAQFTAAGTPDYVQLRLDQTGFRLPWEPGALQVLQSQSPYYLADRIHTPALLEYGDLSAARSDGAPFFGILQHFKVPSEFVVYPRTGHGAEEPVLLLDSFERNLAWFDRWLKPKHGSN